MSMGLSGDKAAAVETSSARKEVDWAALKPVRVDHEDAMSEQEVQKKWTEMYKLAGLRSPSEKTCQSFRLGVYHYVMVNGTSREGQYSGEIVLADGTKFEASVIPKAVGLLSVRRFFRGTMRESYRALKDSETALLDPRFIAKCSEYGVAAAHAFATADWFRDCPDFAPEEAKAHARAFDYSVSRARRARGGHNLESVEQGRRDAKLETQGRADAADVVPGVF